MRNTLTTVLVAAMLVLSAGFATAAVQFDDETTNTATTSDITATSYNVTYNESASVYLEAQVETTTPAFEVVDPETNETLAYKNGTDLTQTYSDTATSPNTYYYATNVSQSVFSDVEMAAGEEKRIEVTIINNESAASPTTTTQNMTLHNDGKRTFLKLEDSEIGDSGPGALVTQKFAGMSVPFLSQNVGTIEDTVAINGSGTTATLALGNQTMVDRFDVSAESASAGDWVPSTVLTVDDEPVKVYADEAPSDVSANDTYGVYDTSSDELQIHFGDDFQGASSADVSVNANDDLGAIFSTYGVRDVIGNIL